MISQDFQNKVVLRGVELTKFDTKKQMSMNEWRPKHVAQFVSFRGENVLMNGDLKHVA